MLSIGICDDDKVLCGDLENKLLELAKQNLNKIETVVFSEGEEILKYIRGGNSLNLIFLDIQMKDISGIEVGLQIRNQIDDQLVQIVYISASEKYAMKLFKVRPMDFLIKPISMQRLEETYLTACELLSGSEEFFNFNVGQSVYRISLKDILYFESDGKKVKIVSKEDKHFFYGRLKDVSQQIKEMGFISIHKSLLVNQNQIIKYEYSQLTMSNGTVLPISQSNRVKVRQIQLQRRKESLI